MTEQWQDDDARVVQAARELYQDPGRIEIDDYAPVSRGGDPGAYVQAWVWVPFPDGGDAA